MTKNDSDYLKNASRNWSVDMSPEAISRRLDTVDELNRLCSWLGTARPVNVESKGIKQHTEPGSVA